MIEVVLILEDKDTKHYHIFSSSEALEDYLETVNLNDYVYTNILFKVNDKINHKMSFLYCDMYLKK